MKIRGILAVATIAALCAALPAQATVLAEWTYEVNTPADLSNSGVGPAVAGEGGLFAGSSTMNGVHANAATDWSTPTGNGSVNGYSVNTWEIGDYFQFSTTAAGYKDITIQWDQTSSNTGPKDFELFWSTDGSTFNSLGSYVSLWNGASEGFWGATYRNGYTNNVAGPVDLNNAANVHFRMVLTSTSPANPTSTFGAGGTNRVDNITISGNVVPEPATLALLAAGGLMMIRRRK